MFSLGQSLIDSIKCWLIHTLVKQTQQTRLRQHNIYTDDVQVALLLNLNILPKLEYQMCQQQD